MSRSEFMATPACSTNETHSTGLGSEFNNVKSPFLAAPAEIRQQILSHFFDVARIDHKGDIICSPPDLENVCQLLREDMEVLQRLWMPSKCTVLRLNSPAEMRQVPAAILRLRNKLAQDSQEWGYFKEVELDIFHPDALEEARKDSRYPGFLATSECIRIRCKRYIRELLRTRKSSETELPNTEVEHVAEIYCTELVWQDCMPFLYPALNLDGTSIVKFDVARCTSFASILRGATNQWGWLMRTILFLEFAVASVHHFVPLLIQNGTLGYDATVFPFGALGWDSNLSRPSSSEVLGGKVKQLFTLKTCEHLLG
ncbi:hypothetical protein BU16DRAFT_532588 [Lophium mytilinum]|uniref:Uncharacterized protein n=1 Tax=Lophium mytilinum TaxID=390894 RepID=A0A6A6RCM2_9PEZI|nr:hypothetical protein BU16DRAFT_532588 [Lophium mytilinum]